MRFINSSFTDAGFNLAAEEYLLKQGTEDVFMLWQSAPSVIIGKHQRVETEVNRTMAEQNKIPVFRRFSGGGAVYHDLGNINLTFIETTCLEELWQEFPAYSQYEARSALAKCGLTTKHIESKVRVLSGGEQAKLRLCKLVNRQSNLLVLDEPTNHLDVDAKDELKRALQEYRGSILMVCHEPEFYEGLATKVWDCSKWTTRV